MIVQNVLVFAHLCFILRANTAQQIQNVNYITLILSFICTLSSTNDSIVMLCNTIISSTFILLIQIDFTSSKINLIKNGFVNHLLFYAINGSNNKWSCRLRWRRHSSPLSEENYYTLFLEIGVYDQVMVIFLDSYKTGNGWIMWKLEKALAVTIP